MNIVVVNALLAVLIILLVILWIRMLYERSEMGENPLELVAYTGITIFQLSRTPPLKKRHPHHHANDPQNAHDSTVVNGLKRKYKRLLSIAPETQVPAKDGVELAAFKKWGISDQFVRICEYTDNLEGTASFLEGSPTESDVLDLVWNRIHHSDNADIRSDAIDNLLINIIDSYGENGNLVCLTGRLARILSSLDTLDKDSIIGEPILDEAEIANIIYNWTGERLREMVHEAGLDVEYNTTLPSRELSVFLSEARDKIREEIKIKYGGMLSSKKMGEIIHNALEGIS